MNTLPLSGYTLDRVFAQEQTFLGHANSEEFPTSTGDPRAAVAWDWHLVDESRFTVALTLSIEPTRERPETVRVMMLGLFTRVGEVPSVEVLKFVQTHAPAIMMPYVREAVSSLTGRGYYGPVNLPPINVAALMLNFDIEATSGMKRARADRKLGMTFGALPGSEATNALPSG